MPFSSFRRCRPWADMDDYFENGSRVRFSSSRRQRQLVAMDDYPENRRWLPSSPFRWRRPQVGVDHHVEKIDDCHFRPFDGASRRLARTTWTKALGAPIQPLTNRSIRDSRRSKVGRLRPPLQRSARVLEYQRPKESHDTASAVAGSAPTEVLFLCVALNRGGRRTKDNRRGGRLPIARGGKVPWLRGGEYGEGCGGENRGELRSLGYRGG